MTAEGGLLIDQEDLHAESRGFEGRGNTGGPAPHDHEISMDGEVFRAALGLSPGVQATEAGEVPEDLLVSGPEPGGRMNVL